MADVSRIDSLTGPPQNASSDSDSDEVQLQNAFAQGIAQIMMTFVEGAESDVTDALNDNTSDPDAPS